MLCHGLKPRELRHATPGAHGYRGGGGSSSSSSTTQTTVDKRLVVDTGVGVSSDSSTVNVSMLDAGTVSKAIDFATATGAAAKTMLDSVSADIGKVLAFAGSADAESTKSLESILNLGATLFDKSFTLLDKAQTGVREQGALVAAAYDDAKGQGNEKQLVAYAVLGVVAFVAVKSWGK